MLTGVCGAKPTGQPCTPCGRGWSWSRGLKLFRKKRLDTERAIQLYTIDNAHLSFEENDKGSVEEGKLGNFTVMDSDPTRVPVETIKDIEVAMTIIGGATVYSK